MKTLSFVVDFGYGYKPSDSAVFSLELNEEEIAYLINYLRENGNDCDYSDIEYDNWALFNKLNDAANDAVLEEINRHLEKKIDFFDVDWTGLSFDFIWPEELTE